MTKVLHQGLKRLKGPVLKLFHKFKNYYTKLYFQNKKGVPFLDWLSYVFKNSNPSEHSKLDQHNGVWHFLKLHVIMAFSTRYILGKIFSIYSFCKQWFNLVKIHLQKIFPPVVISVSCWQQRKNLSGNMNIFASENLSIFVTLWILDWFYVFFPN